MVRQLFQKMTIGPKGQVVIPKIFRDIEKISPGTEVLLELKDEGILIKKKEQIDIIKLMKNIAKSISKKDKVNSDKDYEEMLEERWKKSVI